MGTTLTRAEWVNKYFTAFMRVIDAYPSKYDIDIFNSEVTGGKITQITYQVDDYHLEYGTAKCSTSDTYFYKTGIAIAYARLIGEQLHPDFICDMHVKLKALKAGDIIKLHEDSEYSCKVLNTYKDTVDGSTATIVTVKSLKTGRYFVYNSKRTKKVLLINS